MVANSSDSLIPDPQTERRPAIWPWLVMPLVTLALYYGLDTLKHSQGDESHSDAGQVAASSSVETGTR